MKRILVTGAAGQIGSELVPVLRERYGGENVVAAGNVTPLPEDVRDAGPHTTVNVTDYDQLEGVIKEYQIDTIYHLGRQNGALGRRLAAELTAQAIRRVRIALGRDPQVELRQLTE